MTDLNHVVLVGRLTRDLGADERSFAYTPSGQARANVSIAVNRSRKNGDQWIEEANFFDITIWGKTAENLKPYLTKGKQIVVEGYLKQDRWEKDGQKFSKITIQATNVQLLGGKSDGGSGYQSGNGQPAGWYVPRFQPKAPQSMPAASDEVPYGDSPEGFPEDIPF